MDPGDEAYAPIAGIQADDVRTHAVEAHRPLLERASEGGIMRVRGGEQEQQGQTGAATHERVDALAAQERP
ncbi:MAG TPA: hypothetical protein VGP82_02215 [Ktedonobacterales bacterium]|nr:hypothetical protein [Ktedonobacterales bacterium]